MALKTFPLVVERSTMITPSVLELAFRRADGDDLAYVAGQFLNIHFEVDDKLTHRSYSIANAPRDGGTLDIAIAPVEGGRATKLLFGLKPGDEIQASGPFGRFILRDDPPCRYILVGTGTGITPYRAMLPGLADRLASGDYSVEMLMGVQYRKDKLYHDDFAHFADTQEKFRYHACLSREDHCEKPEVHGYVQHQFGELNLDPETDVVYLCGNPDMIDNAVDILKEKGFELKQLRREKYLPARS